MLKVPIAYIVEQLYGEREPVMERMLDYVQYLRKVPAWTRVKSNGEMSGMLQVERGEEILFVQIINFEHLYRVLRGRYEIDHFGYGRGMPDGKPQRQRRSSRQQDP